MDPLTVQYRLDLPSVLHSISPALSALHTSRAVARHPDLSALLRPTHCLKCGAYRYDAPPSAKKNRRRAKKRCHLCGHSAQSASKTVSVTPPAQEPAESHHRISQTNALATRAPVAPLPGQHSHPKSSHPRGSSLRDMLSRNRRRDDHKESKDGHDGLALFLKEL